MIPSDTADAPGAIGAPSNDIGQSNIGQSDIGRDVEIDVSVRAAPWNEINDLVGLARQAVTQALKAVGENQPDNRAPGLPGHAAEISLVFADADLVATLNSEHRGKTGPTNVLSFPASDDFGTGVTLLGDVVLAYEVVADEARAQNISIRDHVAHLLVHGTLHLFGYDHILDAQAQVMEALETRILKALNIADPYGADFINSVDPTKPINHTKQEHQARRTR